MKKIQMVDLQTQYQRIKEDIDRGIQSVIDSTSFIKGPAVASFQANLEEYTGAKHVIPVGKVIKAPEEYTDVRGQVTTDYQDHLEKLWVQTLRDKYPVVVNEEVLKAVE